MSVETDRVVAAVDLLASELVDFAAELVRYPTVNPPGGAYAECARAIGQRLGRLGFDVEYEVAEGRPEHSADYPRVNVIGRRQGRSDRPLVHLNGHIDVVPPGDGWTVPPFGGLVRDGRLYGRGSCDMKAGLAAAVYAAEALRRADVPLRGSLEISGTVDEESGGFAGVALLCERGRISRARTDHVIIPEPFGPDRICIGHRGVHWTELTLHGRIAHGSMPFLGVNAIEHMGAVLDAVRTGLLPALHERTTALPVVPEGARHATMNVNAIWGGQADETSQTPCVADRCTAVFDRRFLMEESFDAVCRELPDLLERLRGGLPDLRWELRDLLTVHPVRTPEGSALVTALQAAIGTVSGLPATLVASPGTYDHKHVARIAGVEHCVAYGPGILELAHQPDEWCGIDDLVASAKVLALTLLRLVT